MIFTKAGLLRQTRVPPAMVFGALGPCADGCSDFDAKSLVIAYYCASRLAGEASGVNDIHLHPPEPRQLRGSTRANIRRCTLFRMSLRHREPNVIDKPGSRARGGRA